MDAATKKLFALVTSLEQKINRLDELEARLAALDTNGKLESVQRQMGEIKSSMAKVAADGQVVVSTVISHGDTIARLEKTLTRLDLRCPLMKPGTDEFPKVVERVKLKDE